MSNSPRRRCKNGHVLTPDTIIRTITRDRVLVRCKLCRQEQNRRAQQRWRERRRRT